MTQYVPKPNTGSLFSNTKKQSEKAPDRRGDITLSPELVRELANNVNAKKPAKIRVAGWDRTSAAGNQYVSLSVELDKPREETPF